MTDQLCKLIELVANRTTVKFAVRFADGSSFISQRGETKVVVSFKTFAAEWKKGTGCNNGLGLVRNVNRGRFAIGVIRGMSA